MPEPVKVATPPASATPAPAAVKPAAAPAEPVKPAVTPAPAAQPAQGTQTVPLPELMEERNKRQALERSVQEMQIELAAMKRVAPAPAPAAQPQDEYRKQLDHLWETDPRKAVQAEIMTAFTWYDTTQAQIDTQEHNLSTKYPDYNNVRNEIRNYIRSLPIEQRARDGVVELAYYAVKGQRVDSTLEGMKKEWEADFLRRLQAGELTGVPAGAVSAPPIIPSIQATAEERAVADAMGMSVEDYLKNRRGGAK
jgi:hypothetical protein